jgi:hypothetical protein
MRAVDRKTFLELPGDVLFQQYYKLRELGKLEIRCGQYSDYDFVSLPLNGLVEGDFLDVADKLEKSLSDDSSIELDFENTYRSGFVEDHEHFAVWEARDVKKLIKRLQEVINYER